jgi:hypothetical protein
MDVPEWLSDVTQALMDWISVIWVHLFENFTDFPYIMFSATFLASYFGVSSATIWALKKAKCEDNDCTFAVKFFSALVVSLLLALVAHVSC